MFFPTIPCATQFAKQYKPSAVLRERTTSVVPKVLPLQKGFSPRGSLIRATNTDSSAPPVEKPLLNRFQPLKRVSPLPSSARLNLITHFRCTMASTQEAVMAKKDRLTEVSVKIGTTLGKANKKAHQLSQAGQVAKEELLAISKQVEDLKRQLEKTTKRLKKAIS